MAFPVPADWRWRPSPNHGHRRKAVSAIVLHADASSRIASSLDWIRRAESRVSYHVIIDRDGTVYAVVTPDRAAWHAGKSMLSGEPNCNAFSVGVCLSNRNNGVEPYPAVQVSAGADVCARICRHYTVPVARIVTHAHVAPDRKTDPLGFDVAAFQLMVDARLAA